MIRELQVNVAKNVPSTCKAEVEMKTGMGAAYDIATDSVDFPAAAEGVEVFILEKERIPTGRNAGIVNLSDYTDEFVTIAAEELCQRIPMYAGERYGTDQYAAVKPAIGDKLAVGTDGKWVTATTGTSRFICGGDYDDAGHPLIIVEVLAAPATV